MHEADVTPPVAHNAESPAPARDAVASLAGQLRHAAPGVLARLRRSHPQQDSRSALFEAEWMLQAAGIAPHDAAERQRWLLVLHCLAIAQGLHDPRSAAEPGAVLARLRVSEARLRQLVEADEHVLADLIPRLTRRVAAAGAALNWWPLVQLLLHTGTANESMADQARQRLVQQYLRAGSAAAADTSAT
jgi:hypothetical protein